MDRTKQLNWKKSAVMLALALGSHAAFADSVLAPPFQAVEPPGPGEDYPASNFGSAPAKIDMGVSSHYASLATKDMDEEVTDDDIAHAGPVEGSGSGARAPASLVFGADAANANPQYPNGKPDGSAYSAAARRRSTSSKSQKIARRVSYDDVQPQSMGGGPVVSQASSVSPEMASMARKGVQEVSVIAGDLGFFPKTIFVTRDVPVRLFVTGASKNTLCLMMDSFQVRKQVRSQKIEEIAFTPSIPGTYRFYCPVNGMEGSMIVKELTTTVAAEEGMSNPTTEAAEGGRPIYRNEPRGQSARVPASVGEMPPTHPATDSAGR